MRAFFAVSSCCVFFVGCDNGGSVLVRANGEFTGAVPAEFFADGSDVAFDQFVVVVDSATVGDGTFAGPAVVDVSGPDPVDVGLIPGLAAGTADVSAVTAPIGDTVVSTNVDDDTLAVMTDGGFSLFVRGSAVVAGVSKTFNWGFTTNTRYVDCAASADVTAGATTEVQLTFHADHLFLPTLDDAEDVQLQFAPLAAADDNGDNAIDVDELRGVEVASVDGYDASADPTVVTLYDFLQAQTRTLLHLNGDNECAFEKR